MINDFSYAIKRNMIIMHFIFCQGFDEWWVLGQASRKPDGL